MVIGGHKEGKNEGKPETVRMPIHPSSVFKTCFKSVKPASPVSPVTPVHVAHPLASGLQNVELVSHGNCLGLTFTAKADLINSQ